MRKLLPALIIIFLLSLQSCSKEDSPTAATGTRIGAVCKDGTRTDATGSGACSHHGGVDYWLYQ